MNPQQNPFGSGIRIFLSYSLYVQPVYKIVIGKNRKFLGEGQKKNFRSSLLLDYLG